MKKLTLSKQNIDSIDKKIGVYQIWACDSNCNPITINRFCGIDNNGLLYIGCTIKQNLRKRLNQFYSSTIKANTHAGGIKYQKRKKIKKILKKDSLWFNFIITKNPKEKETELLIKYINKFGEHPPLNK